MKKETVLAEIKNILSSTFGIQSEPDQSCFEMQLDSLDTIELTATCELEFGVNLNDEFWGQDSTMEELADMIISKSA